MEGGREGGKEGEKDGGGFDTVAASDWGSLDVTNVMISRVIFGDG